MGQPVIVDNRPGASNNLGTDTLAKSAPDGYTIGIVGGSHNINKFLFKNLPWDPEKSFEPIVYTHVVPLVFAIYPQIPAKTLPEFIAWMKANPNKAKVATSGRGSAQEMAAEMFRMATGARCCWSRTRVLRPLTRTSSPGARRCTSTRSVPSSRTSNPAPAGRCGVDRSSGTRASGCADR